MRVPGVLCGGWIGVGRELRPEIRGPWTSTEESGVANSQESRVQGIREARVVGVRW